MNFPEEGKREYKEGKYAVFPWKSGENMLLFVEIRYGILDK